MSHTVRIEWEEQVAHLVLARPARRNALDGPMWTVLREKALELAQMAPRAVILRGEGEHFCSGMDLSMTNPLVPRLMPAVMGKNAEELRTLVHELKAVMQAVADLPAPVIAALHGSCLGAGLELALCADIRIAASSTVLSLPETRYGMVPDVGGTVRLSRLIGRGRAAQIILAGRELDGDLAERWGVVDELAEDPLARARELAAGILERSPAATRGALGVLRAFPGDAPRFDTETEAGVEALLSGEVMEGFASFAQKRKATW